MADRSAIEWTDASWNPIRARNRKTGKVGWHCEHATTGCINCYSEGFNLRLGTGLPFKPGHRDDIELFLDNEMVLQPLRWKKPRKIFVCSMTDLFADFVPDVWIDTMFAIMALAPQHTFQVLTKRAKRMREYLTGTDVDGRTARHRIDGLVFDWRICGDRPEIHGSARLDVGNDGYDACERWPLPNVWLGVSTERQYEVIERVPDLLAAPATVRFISAEPLVGPLDLHSFFDSESKRWINALDGIAENCAVHERIARIDQVIVGGESGPKARSMHPAWPRLLRDQCAVSGTAFFFKQWGEWSPHYSAQRERIVIFADGGTRTGQWYFNATECERNGVELMYRAGKKNAGRLLDLVEHNGLPEVPA